MSDTLAGVVTLLMFGAALVVAIVFQVSGHNPFVSEPNEPTFFEPFTSDDDMWANIMAAYPNYDTMTDLQKTTALRTWASQHLYVSGPVNVYDHNLFDNDHPYLVFNHFSTFHNDNAGVMCTGYAHALCVLYDYAGFPSLKYDYGSDGCSHSVTLVRIIDSGAQKIIVQDAYFDYYYAWPNGTVMSVYEAFAEVDAARYDNIVPVYDGAIDYLVATPLDEDARAVFGVELVEVIDHDSVVYRYWYTQYNYYKSTKYANSRDEYLGNDGANDLKLLTEQRNIVYFASGEPTFPNDFSVLESDLP